MRKTNLHNIGLCDMRMNEKNLGVELVCMIRVRNERRVNASQFSSPRHGVSARRSPGYGAPLVRSLGIVHPVSFSADVVKIRLQIKKTCGLW